MIAFRRQTDLDKVTCTRFGQSYLLNCIQYVTTFGVFRIQLKNVHSLRHILTHMKTLWQKVIMLIMCNFSLLQRCFKIKLIIIISFIEITFIYQSIFFFKDVCCIYVVCGNNEQFLLLPALFQNRPNNDNLISRDISHIFAYMFFIKDVYVDMLEVGRV